MMFVEAYLYSGETFDRTSKAPSPDTPLTNDS
jgi:hypothetical protein